jgi:glyceraldehyde-3-phosphate dehydrogenase/erythrose-4-phosphate dehydrogenase
VQVLDGRMLSVAAWYDNEMGYATRLAETARVLTDARTPASAQRQRSGGK